MILGKLITSRRSKKLRMGADQKGGLSAGMLGTKWEGLQPTYRVWIINSPGGKEKPPKSHK